jgi:phytanoyl-CoA hydroxylase
MSYRPIQLTETQIQQFQADGFLILENFLPLDLTQSLVERIDPLFHGKFETGLYPDEWHWRPGLSLPDVTRQMCNTWKCDLTVASLVLSAEMGRLSATLAGWEGARIGQDCVWMKPPGATEIAMHQDGLYIDYLTPPEMMTCWIALNDATPADGTLVYAKGSHKWDAIDLTGEFHAPTKDFRWAMSQQEVARFITGDCGMGYVKQHEPKECFTASAYIPFQLTLSFIRLISQVISMVAIKESEI